MSNWRHLTLARQRHQAKGVRRLQAFGSRPQADTIAVEKPKGGELAKWAGILCNDPLFWKWANLQYKDTFLYVDKNHIAASYIRLICGIDSRVELDHNKEAAQTFREEIMKPFDEWKAKNA